MIATLKYEAENIIVETFESSVYCNVSLPQTGFRLSCRRLPQNGALCVSWRKLDDKVKGAPTDEMKRCAEAYSMFEFAQRAA